MNKDMIKDVITERNPCGEVLIGRSDDKNEEDSPYRAHSGAKMANKRQYDKKRAFAANYGPTSGEMSGKTPEEVRKLAQESLDRFRANIILKPTSNAEDLDLPSPAPSRKLDPNSVFKRKQYDKRMGNKSIKVRAALKQLDDEWEDVEDDDDEDHAQSFWDT